MAELVVANDVIPQLVFSLGDQNRFYKKAAAFVLRAVAKHSAPLAQAVVDAGALEALVTCLEEFDPGVKEAAAWAVGYIARHTPDLAQYVVDAGAVSLLVLAVQEPELPLKRISVSSLADVAKHTPELAQAVVDAGGVAFVAPLLESRDAKLRRQVCACLGHISKHSVDLAELVVEAEVFPRALICLKDTDPMVQRNAAVLVREVVKHTPELAQLVTNAGGVGALVEYSSSTTGNARLPAIMALGFIGAFSETLASAVIVAHGVKPIVNALTVEPEDHVKAASAWTLGQLGRHSSDHAKAVVEANVLPKLVAAFSSSTSSPDLKSKCKRACKSIVQQCTLLPALDPLLQSAPAEILKFVIAQYAKVLPTNAEARKQFVVSGGLKRVQELEPEHGTELAEHVQRINACYPDEVVRHYAPTRGEDLLRAVEAYKVPIV
eukprot:gnl/Carplike_NY0171/2301_a3101_808.p1 GENE.gnl/Carplike_NY0171/2301_a3101_808~~gnl/Carplike_NY0171/2301_a3101_808.p1  ORF type:complete len:506 (+),score=161.16 gnl/Carplike_NY0171/2301_a3101_808:212-1519(+)